MLPAPSIRKFLRESFAGGNPVILTDPIQQREWLKPVQEKLEGLNRVTCKFQVIQRLKLSEQINQLEIDVEPAGNHSGWSEHERYRLYFSDEAAFPGTLMLAENNWRRTNIAATAVSSPEEIETFIDKIKTRQDRNQLREKKAVKISNLKESGMKARLKGLAQEHDFGFAIGQNARNVNLSLRVAGRKTGFHFSFPKGQFDAVIAQLPELIRTFENMGKLGITFRTNNLKWQQSGWIFSSDDSDD